jgi:hydroxyacylglutathione hydrolase
MLHDQPPRPANMANIVAINRGKLPLTLEEPEVPPLPTDAARQLIAEGCLVLDTREHEAFDRSHIPGAYGVQQSSASFEQNVGWILPSAGSFLLVVNDANEARLAAHKLAFVGLDRRVVGFLEIGAWASGRNPSTSLPRIEVDELKRRVNGGQVNVLDVRERDEWDAGHIRGARHVSFKLLPGAIDRLALSPADPVAVVCAAGMRSSTACSILRRRGFEQVTNVAGGMNAWNKAGLPVIR